MKNVSEHLIVKSLPSFRRNPIPIMHSPLFHKNYTKIFYNFLYLICYTHSSTDLFPMRLLAKLSNGRRLLAKEPLR